MRTFNNVIKTNNVKVKVFNDMNILKLEADINQWLGSVSYEIVSIEFSTDSSYKRVLIIYKIG